MAEEVNINIKITSNLDATASTATKSIDEVKKSADEASKSIEKTGSVTEKATALIDKFTGGLASKIKGISKSTKELGTGLVSAFKAGTKGASALQKALISTGIGAIVVAVGMLVAYWDDIVEFIGGASAEQEKLLAAAEKNVAAQQEALDAISLQENSLRLAGKSEKEIRDLKIQQTNETITALEAQLAQQEAIKKSQIDAAKRNRDILTGVVEFMSVPLKMLLTTVDSIGAALGQDFGLEKKFSESVANMVFDPKEVEEAADETIKETKNQIEKLKSQRDGFLLADKKERADAAKAAADKAAKDDEAARAKEKERLAAIASLNKETLDLIAANQEAAIEDEVERENVRFANLKTKLQRERDEQIKAAEGNAEMEAAIRAKYNALEQQATLAHNATIEGFNKAAQEKLAAQDKQASDIRLGLIADDLQRELALLQAKYDEDVKLAENNEKLKAALKEQYEAQKAEIEKNYTKQTSDLRQQTLNAELDVVKGALEAIGQIAGEQSILAKTSAIAGAIINTYQAATNALANTPAPPPFPQIAAGAAIAAGLASVRKIIQTPVPNGDGGLSSGGASVSAPAIQQPQFNVVGQSGTNQLAQSISSQFNQPVRAYVVGQDVTTSQQLERQRIKTASFG